MDGGTAKDAWKAVGVVLFVMLVAAAGWWFAYGSKVLASEPIGKGDAIIQKNSAENWLKAQARFEDMYANIEAADRNIVIAHQAYENEASTFNERNYTGLQMSCMDMISEYNAEARKYLAQEFRAIDLPAEIDQTMSTTDCKE